MAKRASEKLDSIGDTDFQAVFKRIFKVDIRDDTQFYTPIDAPPPAPGRKAFTIVYGALNAIGTQYTATNDQLNADVRFYCDNDAHWSTRHDLITGNTEYLDNDNQMKLPSPNKRPCANPPSGQTWLGYTWWNGRIPNPNPPQSQARSVITLCDALFDPSSKGFGSPRQTMDDIPKNDDLTALKDGVKEFKFFVALTILHEIMHTSPWYLLDVGDHGQPNRAYGWDTFLKNPASDNVQNADCYGYLGIWALLADRAGTNDQGGYTLPRLPPNGEPQNEQLAEAGKIELYLAITKRSLQKLARRTRKIFVG